MTSRRHDDLSTPEYIIVNNLPILQVGPVNPALQLQVKPPFVF